MAEDIAQEEASSNGATAPFRFGDFELLEQIGRGGMGVVYRARNLKLGVIVALKRILHADAATPQELDRLRIEAETAANCRHPNIVAVHEFGHVNGEYFFTMDFIEGKNLAQRIAHKEFAIPESRTKGNRAQARQIQERIAKLMATVARAIHQAHECRFLHRDLTPSNILVDANNQPFITDFGVAKALSAAEDVVSGSHVVGKPSYMSPEQAGGKKIGFAADIYGLGAILYELLTGRPPFRGTTPLDTLRMVTDQEVEAPSSHSEWVDQDLASICLKCLEKEPGRRYSTAQDLAEDLERWSEGNPVKARRAGPMRRTWRWVRRNPVGTALIITLFLGMLSLIILQETARSERTAKDFARNMMVKWIGYSINNFGEPSRDWLLLPSEALSAFRGKNSQPGPVTSRVTVGVFIVRSPAETIIGFADVLQELERIISSELGETIRFDLRLYRSYGAARADLLEGRVDLMRAEPRLYLESKAAKDKMALVVAESASDFDAVIFTRRDTGITNLLGLAGRSFVFWDRSSCISLLAKSLLFDAHLTHTNLLCSFLSETTTNPFQQGKGEIEAPDGGYLDPKGATVNAVQTNCFDAGIALERQLRIHCRTSGTEKDYWVTLTNFPCPGCVWFAKTNLNSRIYKALQRVMRGVQNSPRTFLGRDMFGDRIEIEFKEARDRDYETLRRALNIGSQFDGADISSGKAREGVEIKGVTP